MISALPMNHAEWLLAFLPAALLGSAVLLLLVRRAQIRHSASSHQERARARDRGSHKARLLHPSIDLSQCIGCGACIEACPEEGVLALMHGQAVVIHGARCVGHGRCAAACPTGGIALTFGDLSQRRDLPVTTPELEAVGMPGLFLAGEISGFSLVRTAVAHGAAVADAVATRMEACIPSRPLAVTVGGLGVEDPDEPRVLDLLIVGAGPAGLSCALRSKERGTDFLVIEQEERIGGTVASYPRKKLVMTQPMILPLHGRLTKLSFEKEELVELWTRVVATHDLPIRSGVRLSDIGRTEDGLFKAVTSDGEILARNVCLALGRRGSPRKLGVPGEDLPKVAYSLLDAHSIRGRRILVVGGGDSAIEAAVGLAEQPGNQVEISYRKAAFFRLKARNDRGITRALHEGRIRAHFESEVVSIEPDRVRLKNSGGEFDLPNDDVFVLAGGDPPFALLERAGISFDPSLRLKEQDTVERSSNLLGVLVLALICGLVLAVWAMWFRAYYQVDPVVRAGSSMHPLLRPAGPVGLGAGVCACAMFLWNLTYLLRRSQRWGHWLPGTLRTWMGSHVFTGLMAVLCVLVHSGFSLRPTVGGHALLALAFVVAAGCVGRYLYAFVPRAANGTEASLDELRAHLATLSAEWDREGRGFGSHVREYVDHLIDDARWRPGLLSRVAALVRGQVALHRSLAQARRDGVQQGIPEAEVLKVLQLSRRAYRLTLMVTHYEEIRAVLSSWRYFHRWLGLLLVLLTIIHIGVAARYATLDFSGSRLAHRGSR